MPEINPLTLKFRHLSPHRNNDDDFEAILKEHQDKIKVLQERVDKLEALLHQKLKK